MLTKGDEKEKQFISIYLEIGQVLQPLDRVI